MNRLSGFRIGGPGVPLVLQTETAECGLACLAMVAGFHGHTLDLPILRRRFPISLKGMNLAQLMHVARRLGLSCRPVRMELGDLRNLRLPAILHWDLNHYVVLVSISSNAALIHDPAAGTLKLSMAEVSKHFTGVAGEIEPTATFQRTVERQPLNWRSMTGRVRGLKTSLAQVLVLAIALEVFALFGPFLMQWIIDDALVSRDADLLVVIVTGLFLLGTIQIVIRWVRSRALLYLSTSLNLQWAANVMGHLLRLPVTFFERRHMGDIVSRFGAITKIQQTLTTSFIAAILDGLMAFATGVMLFLYSPALTYVVLAAVVIYALLRVARYSALHKASEKLIVLAARQQSHFMETVRAIQAIKLFNGQDDRHTRFLQLTVAAGNANVEVQRLDIMFQTINRMLTLSEGVLVLWLGSQAVLGGAFSVGMLIAFIAYKDQFSDRLMSLVDKSVELRMLRLQAERLSDIVLSAPEPDATTPVVTSQSLQPTIELKGVRFRYGEGDPWVIDGLSIAVAAGESVVLVGPSGCGKTTTLKIILGELEPVEGEVLVGGIPLRQLGLAFHRSLIGVVMQDDILLAGSLAENICFFSSEPDQAHIERCARTAHIHDYIMSTPMGYNTLVGDMGTTLSGGQRQRVILARALYKRPRILLLDEATSHLDVELERDIGIEVARMSITRVVIAHRPETVRSGGRIIPIGPQP